ncbi:MULTISPECIES: 50S ribosomal protein L6 [Paraglaciecola]|jgi:large subunit ribosomal protein L6|uniref:Large ribosomal subunit protein uL6 n=6 Tax=Paraglaciecola TaxID=1621534 RepID=RL6_PSEA6|nr:MULTISPECIES: 50S ribosomal protein L6 [Paraglaciecola]Q15X58.1 RecName: Full=Large ribosomal subunit protein uL6; AltName: Full=50S ribosomal protein L6 [Paraglaciecola sp. T6c]ABG39530.1 LSU ribosomal protein L6P [Paraglaciecola sp. T6c]GAC03860.1 large subunit ribosomal protein L6 [Paraglaciecola agarilytica NO2]GAC10931.1 large subunit ribosomal protein L6 [Paraglaciecola chathamensis S18K6]GAC22416.1 large subunit ribosomal protein L6 [Paraglaciecola mesophila KMM 241]GGZ73552.1 50S r|tara:strand:- start:7321 stop:7854 length:534 start_codon:yes stop_codon:yes gene_type:complete
MSRIAKAPVDVLSGVEVTIAGQEVTVKGKNGTLSRVFNDAVEVVQEENQLKASPREGVANGWAQAGTARSLLDAMVIGVSQGFEKKLQLNGVGYRAAAQGKKLNLTLGFSHPVAYEMPEGISVETPSQTEIVVKGADKQLVGQVAANIRGYRPPEPYKGKGVRYADEVVRRKEAKKK